MLYSPMRSVLLSYLRGTASPPGSYLTMVAF
nr:MAG TPA: hypothetical protein [Caudoviricetes sp.]